MEPAKVTQDHIDRAKRMIGCILDVEEVSQWLANQDADKAEIKRLQDSLPVLDDIRQWLASQDADKLELQRLRGRLPQTDDGVDIVPGDTLWTWGDDGEPMSMTASWVIGSGYYSSRMARDMASRHGT